MTKEHLFLHCNEFFGRTESKISYVSSLTTVAQVESFKTIQSWRALSAPVLVFILLMTDPSQKVNLEGLQFVVLAFSLVLGVGHRELHPTKYLLFSVFLAETDLNLESQIFYATLHIFKAQKVHSLRPHSHPNWTDHPSDTWGLHCK